MQTATPARSRRGRRHYLVLASAAVAVGIGVGLPTNVAQAYPPLPPPTTVQPPVLEVGGIKISDPIFALPGTTVTIVVTGVTPGSIVEFTLDGVTYRVRADTAGRAVFAPVAPTEIGTYEVVATIDDGTQLTTEIYVVETLPTQRPPLVDTGTGVIAPGLALGLGLTAGGAAMFAVGRRRHAF